MFRRYANKVGNIVSKVYRRLFENVYQFDSPVCFLNEEDYDMSGFSKKFEPDFEDEFSAKDDTPGDPYAVLTRNLIDLVLGECYEKLVNLERTESMYENEIMKDYPGWNLDVFFVLHYEYFNMVGHGKHSHMDFEALNRTLQVLGIESNSERLRATFNKYKRTSDGLIDFRNFLNILYWCDMPVENGSLGYTAESIRVQGLNYRIGSTLDMASLIEYGLL